MKYLTLFLTLLFFSCKKEELIVIDEFSSKICISIPIGQNKDLMNEMTVYYYVSQSNRVSYYIIEKSKDLYYKNPTFVKHDSIPSDRKIGETQYETYFSDTLTNTVKVKMYSSKSEVLATRTYDLRKLKLITP